MLSFRYISGSSAILTDPQFVDGSGLVKTGSGALNSLLRREKME